MEAFEYILSQSINEYVQDIYDDDTHDELRVEVHPKLPPMQHADRCPPKNVPIDITNPSTSMSYTTNDKHKIPQPEECSLVPGTCLHENPSAEFTIRNGILPFFHILNPHNADPASCETYTTLLLRGERTSKGE